MSDVPPGWWPGPQPQSPSPPPQQQPQPSQPPFPPFPSPPRRTRSPLLIVAVLAAVALAGVVIGVVMGGGDDDPAAAPAEPGDDRQEMIDGLSSGLYENFGGTLTHEEAGCAGEAVVNKVGEERLLGLGLGQSNPYDVFSVTELTLEEQIDVVTEVVDCISDDRLAGYLASTYSADGDLTFEQAECVAGRQVELLGPDRMRELTVEGNFQPGVAVASLAEPDEQDDLEAIDQECTAG